MRLPKDLLSETYKRPRLFLCEVDKTKICELEATSMNGSFKFNAYSELTFTVGRTYTNMITGETDVNPFYDKIQALRLVYLEGFGYFEIQEPEIVSDGIREAKNVTAYGYEYTLAQKYLEGFDINTGTIGSTDGVLLYNRKDESHSLLHIALQKVYGWKIGHVDVSLQTMSRQFEISRVSVYDFIVQDICEKFNCFAVFDTIDNTINLYAEALITKFIGDGKTTSFTISPPYKAPLGTVSINSYKTTEYTYNESTGILTLTNPPESGSVIEVTDGSQDQWMTDVYITFDNLAQEINISHSADDIKTVLTVKGAYDLDIYEVNMGLPYIVDISYYHSVDWMGQELFNAYTEYLKQSETNKQEYSENAAQILELDKKIKHEENRTSLQYSIAEHVTHETVGTYYVKGTDVITGYDTYSEVTLPDEYNAYVVYYTLNGTDINEEKFESLYKALQTYFKSQNDKNVSEIEALKEDFLFLKTYTIDYLTKQLKDATTSAKKDSAIYNVLDEIWQQLGYNPLNDLYYKSYKRLKDNAESDGWSNTSNANYWEYYPMVLVVNSLETAMAEREAAIAPYKDQQEKLQNRNIEMTNGLLMDEFFKNYYIKKGFEESEAKAKANQLLIRLSSFLREDEYTDDNFFITDYDTTEDIMQTKRELLECGRIELHKLCEPKLEFSMDMANIYALPEFEPIVDYFQLGNLIRIELRKDYIKRARILAVNINFDDFSDFTCEFGELTSLRTPSSIHADLLAGALSAGKSVASNASYWQKSADKITDIEIKIQQGLLDAVQAVKASDGTQYISADEYGIRLMRYDSAGNIDPKQGWIVNNRFLYSDDGFQTAKTAFGEFNYDGNTFYGVLAEAVIAGYVVGCTIEGGTIKIGKQADGSYVFEVDENGHVTMNAASIAGYVTTDDMETSIKQASDQISLNVSNNVKEYVDSNFSTTKEMNAAIKVSADAITNKVSSVETNLLNNYSTTAEINSAITQKADSITSEVSKQYATIGQTKHYGTCSSISTVVNKVVTCSGFTLYNGATISVKFTYKNAAASPTLNVNNTGAKPIRVYNDSIAADSAYNWSNQSTVVFVYDGSYWQMADSGALYQTANLSSRITQTAESIEAEVTRATNAENTLNSKITINANAITSKVNNGDFGTLIEQNYDNVKIAWNKNSNYIAFEDGALNIYTSSSHSTNTLLMKQNYQGAWYYYKGYTIGKIGTNSWTDDASYRGLVFDLGYDANYMCWAHKDNASDTSYTVKLIYHANDKKRKEGLHFSCNTYANGKLYLNDDYRVIQYTDGSIGYSGEVNFVQHSNTSSSSFRIDGTTKLFEIFGGSSFKIYNNSYVDFYSNINMHNFDIIDGEITTSSDARLKTNIQDSQVDALNVINQIEMKEFDWIENKEHETIGMIAQQLQTIEPSLVYEDPSTGKLSIKTTKFIPYLIKAIQQLSDTNGASTYNMKYAGKPAKWTDQYSISEKEAFVKDVKSNEYVPQNVEKTENVQQPIMISEDNTVSE